MALKSPLVSCLAMSFTEPVYGAKLIDEIISEKSINRVQATYKLPISWRKPGNSSLLRSRNTKEIIINHTETRMVKDGEDRHRFQTTYPGCQRSYRSPAARSVRASSACRRETKDKFFFLAASRLAFAASPLYSVAPNEKKTSGTQCTNDQM